MSGLPRSPAIVSPAPAGVDPARRVLRSTASGSTLGVWWRLAFGDSLLPVAETSISTTHDQATWFRAYDLSVSRRQTLSFDWGNMYLTQVGRIDLRRARGGCYGRLRRRGRFAGGRLFLSAFFTASRQCPSILRRSGSGPRGRR